MIVLIVVGVVIVLGARRDRRPAPRAPAGRPIEVEL